MYMSHSTENWIKEGAAFPMKKKQKHFNYRYISDVIRKKEGKCHSVRMYHYFLCHEPFGTNHIFMAVICDTAKGRLADRRYFLEIVHN